jgi:hypothetical protein
MCKLLYTEKYNKEHSETLLISPAAPLKSEYYTSIARTDECRHRYGSSLPGPHRGKTYHQCKLFTSFGQCFLVVFLEERGKILEDFTKGAEAKIF